MNNIVGGKSRSNFILTKHDEERSLTSKVGKEKRKRKSSLELLGSCESPIYTRAAWAFEKDIAGPYKYLEVNWIYSSSWYSMEVLMIAHMSIEILMLKLHISYLSTVPRKKKIPCSKQQTLAGSKTLPYDLEACEILFSNIFFFNETRQARFYKHTPTQMVRGWLEEVRRMKCLFRRKQRYCTLCEPLYKAYIGSPFQSFWPTGSC